MPLRYRVWSPALARVGRRAHELLQVKACRCRPCRTSRLIAERDPLTLLKGLVSLRRLTGMYPAGHPAIEQKLGEIDGAVQQHLRDTPTLKLDVIHGTAHLDGVSFRNESDIQAQILHELTDLGIDSIHIAPGVSKQELHSLAEFLWQLEEAPSGEPVDCPARATRHQSRQPRPAGAARHALARGALAGRARPGPMDPDYAESLALTERTFDDVAGGRG